MGCTNSSSKTEAIRTYGNPPSFRSLVGSTRDSESFMPRASDSELSGHPTISASTPFIFDRIVQGDLSCSHSSEKVVPKLLIFFSSTFTDTQFERNIAMNSILGAAKKDAQKNGVQLGFVDMRWGVRDENTLHHRTWAECSREINRCRRLSSGMFFISLQSDKYGYRSLPKYIPQELLDSHLKEKERGTGAGTAAAATATAIALAKDWYILDTNALQPVYTLKNLSSLNDRDYWDNVLPVLLELLDGLPFETLDLSSAVDYPRSSSTVSDTTASAASAEKMKSSHSTQLLIGQSITEWELKLAYASQKDDMSRSFWLYRHFDGLFPTTSTTVSLPPSSAACVCVSATTSMSTGTSASTGGDEPNEEDSSYYPDNIELYCDAITDAKTRRRLDSLLDWMNTKVFCFDNKISYDKFIPITDICKPDATSWADYARTWTADLQHLINTSLAELVKRYSLWQRDGCGIGMTGAEADEMLRHYQWAAEKVRDFVGREHLVNSICDFVLKDKAAAVAAAAAAAGGSSHDGHIYTRDNRSDSKNASSSSSGRNSSYNSSSGFIGDDSSSCRQSHSTYQHGKSSLKGIDLAIIGSSGSGKTALMAKIADEIYKRQKSLSYENPLRDRPVILRFCGTSPGSTNGLSLVRSICLQILHCFQGSSRSSNSNSNTRTYCDESSNPVPIGRNSSSDSTAAASLSPTSNSIRVASPIRENLTSNNYSKLLVSFGLLLNIYPVVLLIDSLDQLSDQYSARNDISFLKNIEPHEHTRIVVSTLPDEWDDTDLDWVHCYGCDSKLAEADVPRINVPKLRSSSSSGSSSSHGLETAVDSIANTAPSAGGLDLVGGSSSSSSEAENIFRYLLARGPKRCLTQEQMAFAIEQISIEPTALYIRLALEVVKDWTSFQPVKSLQLARGVRPLINQILQAIEINYGEVFTRAAVGLLTFCVEGLNDAEMEDLLSLHSKVMSGEGVLQYCDSITRLPSHVWLRLRGELYGLITEREDGRLMWYHRQLKEAAQSRYQAEKPLLSRIMATYFGNIVSDEEKTNKQISSQPLLLNDSITDNNDSSNNNSSSNNNNNNNNNNFFTLWGGRSEGVNQRRCVEAVSHMISAGMLAEAVKELCTLEAVCCRAVCGLLFTAVSQLSELVSLLKKNKKSEEDKRRHQGSDESNSSSSSSKKAVITAEHYLRWLLKDGHRISKDPSITTISASCSAQPKVSVVQQELRALVLSSTPVSDSASITSSTSFVNSITVGVCDEFESLVQVLEGYHTKSVRSVTVSADGTKIVSGSEDCTVRIWDAATGTLINTLRGHTYGVLSVAISSDGSRIVSGSNDETIRLWNVRTGITASVLSEHRGAVTCVMFGPDGRKVLSCSNDMTVKLWDTMELKGVGGITTYKDHVHKIDLCNSVYTLKGHRNSVNCCAYSPSGTWLASGSNDTTVCLWRACDGIRMGTLRGATAAVNSICFNANEAHVACASSDKAIRIYEVGTGAIVGCLVGHTGSVQCVRYMSTTTNNNQVENENINNNNSSVALEASNQPPPKQQLRKQSTDIIVSSSNDNTMRLWDATTLTNIDILQGHSSCVYGVCPFPDSSKVVSCSYDQTVRVWTTTAAAAAAVAIIGDADAANADSSNHKSSTSIKAARNLQGHQAAVRAVGFSADGHKIMSCSDDKTIRICLFDKEKGFAVTNVVVDLTSCVLCAAFSPSGKTFVAGARNGDIVVCDSTTGQVAIALPAAHSSLILSVVFSHNEALIASSSGDKNIHLWDATNGKKISRLTGHTSHVNSVAFNATDTVLVSGSGDNNVCLWNVESMELIKTFRGHTGHVNSVAFNPHREKIASASSDCSLRLWDCYGGGGGGMSSLSSSSSSSIAKGEERRPGSPGGRNNRGIVLLGHTSAVYCVAYSRDGTKLVSGSEDKTVRLWDSFSGSPICVLRGHTGYVHSVAFNSDGSRLLSGSEDKYVKVWEALSRVCGVSSVAEIPETVPVQGSSLSSSVMS